MRAKKYAMLNEKYAILDIDFGQKGQKSVFFAHLYIMRIPLEIVNNES